MNAADEMLAAEARHEQVLERAKAIIAEARTRADSASFRDALILLVGYSEAEELASTDDRGWELALQFEALEIAEREFPPTPPAPLPPPDAGPR